MRLSIETVIRKMQENQALRSWLRRKPWAQKQALRIRSLIQNRWSQRRKVTDTSQIPILEKYVTGILVESEHFDPVHYARSANLPDATIEHLASHYVVKGEKEGLEPSATFQPLTYAMLNPDIRDYQPSLLHHYIRYGENEGRGATVQLELENGRRKFNRRKPTVLIGLHELTRTGAPIVGWNIAKNLKDDYNVLVTSLGRGELYDSIRDECTEILSPKKGRLHYPVHAELVKELIEPFSKKYEIKFAIVNSVVSAPIAMAARDASIPVISLIHEFAAPYREKFFSILENSDRVVFSTELTLESVFAENIASSPIRNAVVLPQGRCLVPGAGAHEERVEIRHTSEEFVVLGAGYLEERKGVDLFVGTAGVLKRISPHSCAKFVWSGGGFHESNADARRIREMVEVARLEDSVTFIPPVGALGLGSIYEQADVLFLSSRLDPLPNVAIDALHYGLPIICFEGATGLARYLREDEFLSQLIVPSADCDAAARLLLELSQDQGRLSTLKQRAHNLSKKYFVFSDYKNSLIDLCNAAVSDQSMLSEDIKTIVESKAIEVDMIGGALGHVSSYKDLVSKYVNQQKSAVYARFDATRRPLSGFNPVAYEEVNLSKQPSRNALADWIVCGRPSGPWCYDVVDLSEAVAPATGIANRAAIHIHMHYADMADDFIRRLMHNDSRPDLFITTNSHENRVALQSSFGSMPHNVEVVEVPNIGRDIASFYTFLGRQLQSYDVVGHLHAKRSVHVASTSHAGEPVDLIESWRELLAQNLLGSKINALDKVLGLFEGQPELGLVFPEDAHCCGWGSNYAIAQDFVRELGMVEPLRRGIEFPVGNMFYARPSALAPLFDRLRTEEAYPREPIPIDGTLLHALERLTPLVAESQGYKWLCTKVPGVKR